jgi:hypothetical protein
VTSHAIKTLAAGLLLPGLLLLAMSSARAEDGVLRVGIITDMSGQYADGNGPGSVISAQMAAEEIGGTVAGRRIEIISADHQNKPDVGVAIVRDWIDNKHIDVIAEGVTSSVGLAIQNLTRERKKLFLISGSGSSDLTGKQCSPTSVQWTYDTYASSNATAKAVVARGGTPWFFLTADYAFGRRWNVTPPRPCLQPAARCSAQSAIPSTPRIFRPSCCRRSRLAQKSWRLPMPARISAMRSRRPMNSTSARACRSSPCR